MCGVLALTFIAVTAIEIAILVAVGGLLGGWLTLALIVVAGIAGAALARRQGAAVLRQLQSSLAGGDPTVALVDGALVLAAGVTLLAPGFLTDLIGLSLLIPWVRSRAARRLHRYLASRIERRVVFDLGAQPGDGDDDPPPPGVIDV